MITLRAVLAILLLFGVYLTALVGVALAGALLLLTAEDVQGYVQGEVSTLSGTVVGTLLGSITVMAALISAVFTVNQAADTNGVPVSESDAPELWAFVREVAAEAGVPPPAELRLTNEVNASVSEDSRLLGLLPGRRRLHLGLPLLAELSANELRALLGHEFGHYLGWHTRVGSVVYRGYLALDRIQHNLDEVSLHPFSPVGYFKLLMRGYIYLYARVSFAVRRRQEFEADAVAARVAGPEATVRVLRSLAAIDAHWQDFVRNYLVRTAVTGYAPDDPQAMFVAMLAARRPALDRLKAADPEAEKHNPYASHPSMADRLARLADIRSEVPARLHEPDPSTWSYPKPALLRHLLPDHKIKALPAAQWLDKAARLTAPTASARLLLAATGADATLETVLHRLEAGEAAELAARFDAEDPHRAMARLCEALHGLVGHYLVEAGSAHWRLSWTGPSDLVVSELRSDGVHVLPFAELNTLVFDAVDHRSGVERLRLHLASLRVDPQRPYASVAESTTLVAVDSAPTRRERDRVRRVLVFGGVSLALLVGIFVFAEITPKPLPRSLNTVQPTIAVPPPTTFRYPTGELLPSYLPTYQPSYLRSLTPSFDLLAPLPVTVRPGDTLSQLARCYLTTVAELQRLNGLGDATDLKVGQTLLVPNAILACR
ncbi:M48 family metalloprotease [Kutzneria sp. CA-103260]|uniref:M48 family metalloprotease n=1 Tax=Kutzneria sp. CA-103260 TaxID=2802641 RepID=UPI001BA6FDA4|nr:M48 family metalloprotease [Kutzneria sp. CA-103260]QUQ68589.1 Protease HtpX [Kutzneria sp. CA-103260]